MSVAAARHKKGARAPAGRSASRHRGKRAKLSSPDVFRVALPATTAAALSAGVLTVIHPGSVVAALQRYAAVGPAPGHRLKPDGATLPRARTEPHAGGRITLSARPSPAPPSAARGLAGGRHAAPVPSPTAPPSQTKGASYEPRHRSRNAPPDAPATPSHGTGTSPDPNSSGLRSPASTGRRNAQAGSRTSRHARHDPPESAPGRQAARPGGGHRHGPSR